jgi:hypothetical protein
LTTNMKRCPLNITCSKKLSFSAIALSFIVPWRTRKKLAHAC